MVTVNDGDQFQFICWICGDRDDHDGVPHAMATGDGLTRLDIVEFLAQKGLTWRE